MYETKIFENLNSLGLFLIKKNITDYSFTSYEFDFMNETKINYFLSYKLS